MVYNVAGLVTQLGQGIKVIVHATNTFGPSGVRALLLAAGRNEGGHYFRYFGPSEVRAPAEQLR